ncbi:hypothetical protein K488DRAFT_82545 [Vararia minispora EC-137]|uniref:Uncharacterized protein n=1 Tax=Vararia minispora EC-137 TaxID=1314806 RepID=A0ACB8QWN1_9AGAM|nr:hypothetical protein K488DRAFT_82545 [Vararia minispora EC-137]
MPKEEQYEVENIIKAKAFKNGKKLQWKYFIKWKNYPEEHNSWEPESCLRGGADATLAKFWERANPDKRDRADPSQFKHGTEVYPTGPPRGRTKAKTRAPVASSEPEEEPVPSSSSGRRKRPRGPTTSESPATRKRAKQLRPEAPRTTSEKAVARLLVSEDASGPPQSPSIPDSEEEQLKLPEPDEDGVMNVDDPAPVEEPHAAMPHLRRSSARSVKRMDETMLERSVGGAISAKARALQAASEKASGSSPSRMRKPGPGRSSEGLANTTLLTGSKGGLKSVRTKKPSSQTIGEAVEEILEVADLLNSDVAPIDSTMTGAGTSDIELRIQPPTGKELLELAGAKDGAEDLADFDEVAAPLPQENETTETVAPESGPNTPIIFSPSVPIGSTGSAPGTSLSRWGGWPGTIFNSWVSALPSLPTSLLGFGSGRSARLDDKNGVETSAPTQALNELSLSVTPSLSIPLTMHDFHPPTDLENSSLDNVAPAVIPGKLYSQSAAMKLLSTLEVGGASARIALDVKASPSEQMMFDRLREQLEAGSLFVAVFGNETLAFCSARNKPLADKLAIPASPRDREQTVLVSHVFVKNVDAYIETAVEGESVRW